MLDNKGESGKKQENGVSKSRRKY